MSYCIFTIVSKNYFGLAKALGNSVNRFHPTVPFYIFIADEFYQEQEFNLSHKVISCRRALKQDDFDWFQQSFMYDVTEFCTFLKPHVFLHLINIGHTKLIYLDPDIVLYDGIGAVFDKLDSFSIVLNPTVSEPHTPDDGAALNERLMMSNGLFCLGFAGFSDSLFAVKILHWWKQKLKYECFVDVIKTQFTDQKWADMFIPFGGNGEVCIDRDLGYNVAYWNIHYRGLVSREGKWYVQHRRLDSLLSPLKFFHFSGFDFMSINGKSNFGQKLIDNYPDYKSLVARYYEMISDFPSYYGMGYSYNRYSNGNLVLKTHRRIYFELLQAGRLDCLGKDPFDSDGKFYKLLEKGNLMDRKLEKAGQVQLKLEAKMKSGSDSSQLKPLMRLLRFVLFIIGPQKVYKLSHYLGRLKDPDVMATYLTSIAKNDKK